MAWCSQEGAQAAAETEEQSLGLSPFPWRWGGQPLHLSSKDPQSLYGSRRGPRLRQTVGTVSVCTQAYSILSLIGFSLVPGTGLSPGIMFDPLKATHSQDSDSKHYGERTGFYMQTANTTGSQSLMEALIDVIVNHSNTTIIGIVRID